MTDNNQTGADGNWAVPKPLDINTYEDPDDFDFDFGDEEQSEGISKEEEKRLLGTSGPESGKTVPMETDVPPVSKVPTMVIRASDDQPGELVRMVPLPSDPRYLAMYTNDGDKKLVFWPVECHSLETEQLKVEYDRLPNRVFPILDYKIVREVPLSHHQATNSQQSGTNLSQKVTVKEGEKTAKKKAVPKVSNEGMPDPLPFPGTSSQSSASKAKSSGSSENLSKTPAKPKKKKKKGSSKPSSDSVASQDQVALKELNDLKRRMNQIEAGLKARNKSEARVENPLPVAPKSKKAKRGKKEKTKAKDKAGHNSVSRGGPSGGASSSSASRPPSSSGGASASSALRPPGWDPCTQLTESNKQFLRLECDHNDVRLPGNRCSICGQPKHHGDCPYVDSVNCPYSVCQMDGTAKTHHVSVCRNMMLICGDCKVRGHAKGGACRQRRKRLQKNFELYADNHIYLQYRRGFFSWGFNYIPSLKAAMKLQSKFKYKQVSAWSAKRVSEEIQLAST